MIRVRVDDYPCTENGDPSRHCFENLLAFDTIMQIHKVPGYLLGVIPKQVTDQDLGFLGQLPSVQVALHGVEHDERFQNEFREHLTRRQVGDAIQAARERLERLVRKEVNAYIPPHNVFDLRTVQALVHHKFRYLCGGPGSPAWGPFECFNDRIEYCYSMDRVEYGRSDELLERMQKPGGDWFGHIEKRHPEQTRTLTLHFPWEINIGLEHLDAYLGKLVSAGVTFSRW